MIIITEQIQSLPRRMVTLAAAAQCKCHFTTTQPYSFTAQNKMIAALLLFQELIQKKTEVKLSEFLAKADGV